MKTFSPLTAILLAVYLLATPARAQEPAGPVAAPASKSLTEDQAKVSERFKELKSVLLRMAELTAATDPQRAALLRRTVARANERGVDGQFESLIELLQKEQLSKAVQGQSAVKSDLEALLELLMSEDRSKQVRSEKERIRAFIKEVNGLIKEQKVIRGGTATDEETKKLAESERKLSDKTGDLAQRLDETKGKPSTDSSPSESDPQAEPSDSKNKEGEGKESQSGDKQDPKGEQKDGEKNSDDADKTDKDKKPGDKSDKPDAESKDSKPSDGKPSEGEPKDGKPQDGEPQKGEPQDGEPQDGEPKDSKPQDGKPQPGQPQQGQPKDGEPSESQDSPQQQQQQQPANPAQQRLQQAQERMKEAQRKLEEAKRAEAKEKQEEAIRELEQAKAELEEILRQLREEEIARMLANLESRFRKMLQLQIVIYEGTKRLDRIPLKERDRDDEIESGRLSRSESEIVAEADRAMALLAEDGSAVAFPEAVEEMREDMRQVAERLGEFKVNMMTQGIEEDIISALEEMIEALKKAQKDLQQRQPPPPGSGGGGGQPQEDALVDQIAELKMIRALQMRVNRRTQRYGELIKQEQAEQPDVIQALKQLAERELRIYRVTRDIVAGRNK